MPETFNSIYESGHNKLQVILQNYWGWVNKNLLRMWILWMIILFSLPVLSVAAEKSFAVDELIARARELKLAEQIPWLNLLHYKSTLLGPRQSQVDDADFFLAIEGASNAEAELEADLRGFFSYSTSAHPRCLFPARLHWLNSKLDFAADLPPMDCVKLNIWKDKFQADQVTLLFPGMFMDNPASMFGHTFIRFDRADNNTLLSHTLSYAAAYDKSDHILVYSWKGIFGDYQGKFYTQSYFKTLQRYNDIEQRDIWEYQLNLNQQEIDQLLRHVWEVRGTYFDYYFFRENCAYRLLALLDVARENMNMSLDSHPLYALPVDTVRDIEKAGLIESHYYRPSAYNKIIQMEKQLGSAATELAISIADKLPADALKSEAAVQQMPDVYDIRQQAKILMLADEMLNQNKNLSAEKKTHQLDILSARSALNVSADEAQFTYNAEPPELSHKSARWHIAAGSKKINSTGDERFYEIGLRPSFHDLLDAPEGFITGATISALETELRWYQQQEKLKLQKLNFFSLQSIVPVRSWMKFGKIPTSKSISLQLKQRDISEREQSLEFESQFSLGYASQVSDILMYAMVKTQFDYVTELDKNYALYLGVDVGGLWTYSTQLLSGKTQIRYQFLPRISGAQGDIQKLNIGVQFDLLRNHALRLEYEKVDYDAFDVDEIKLSYLMYF